MKITVATRVIGGFVAISALLIVVSIVSLVNLNSIGSATEEVNDVALPSVAGSNALALPLPEFFALDIPVFDVCVGFGHDFDSLG